MSAANRQNRKIITVDCRDLEPPEPLVKVLEAIEEMRNDEAVLMIHRKRPRLLFPKLREKGLSFSMTEAPDESIELLIWRDKDNV